MDKKGMNACLVKIAKGDNQAFSKLYTETKKGVYAFLYSYFQNVWDTECAMQSVYVKIKEKAHLYKDGTDARAWLLQVAKNLAINELRKKNREMAAGKETLETLGGKTEQYSGEVFEALNKALDDEERQIVILHVLWGYKHKEIALFLDSPLGTITSKYKRSIKKLKDYLRRGEE